MLKNDAEHEQQELLVAILATVDAVFIPERNPNAADFRWRCEARRDYVAGQGIRFTSANMGARRRERQRTSRSIDLLIAGGLVRRHSIESLSLTERGDDEGRALVGLPLLRDVRSLLKNLIDHQTDPRGIDFVGRAWMPETVYAGVKWGDNAKRGKLVQLEERFLPLLVRGLAESNCTPAGHCYYAPTPTGLRWSLSPPIPIAAEASDDLRALYYERVKAGLASMARSGDPPRDIGQIPMPMSIAPRGAAGRDH
jgi:hypothetical protein